MNSNLRVEFPFEKKRSGIFGPITRPVAQVGFWSLSSRSWVDVVMIVDSGADYTLLPRFYVEYLGVNLEKHCKLHRTLGVGGSQEVYVMKSARVKLGQWETRVPLGFLNNNDVPPLLGRKDFLENFKVTFFKHRTVFSDFQK